MATVNEGIHAAALSLDKELGPTYITLFQLSLNALGIISARDEQEKVTFFELFVSLLQHEPLSDIPQRRRSIAASLTCHILTRFSCPLQLSSLEAEVEPGFDMKRDFKDFSKVNARLRVMESLYSLSHTKQCEAINKLKKEVSSNNVSSISELVLMLFEKDVLKSDNLTVVEEYLINEEEVSKASWKTPGETLPDEIKIKQTIMIHLKSHTGKLTFKCGAITCILFLISFSIFVIFLIATFSNPPQSSTPVTTTLVRTAENYPLLLRLTNPGTVKLTTLPNTPPLSIYKVSCDPVPTSTRNLGPLRKNPIAPDGKAIQTYNYYTYPPRLATGSQIKYSVMANFYDEGMCSFPPPHYYDYCLRLFLFDSSDKRKTFITTRDESLPVNSSQCLLFGNESSTTEILFNITTDGVYYVAVQSPGCVEFGANISYNVVYYEVPTDASPSCATSSSHCELQSSCSSLCYKAEDLCLLLQLQDSTPNGNNITHEMTPTRLFNYRFILLFVCVGCCAVALVCLCLSVLFCCLYCCCALRDWSKLS